MFALGFEYRAEDGWDDPGWSIEYVTDDFDEAIENLFDARNDAAAGQEHWEGAQLMIGVLHKGKTVWELLDDGSRV
jgi:hypothetical protein